MVNTLVTHKNLASLGIGCISKELKSSYRVNFGHVDVITVKKDNVVPVDVSGCKTIPFRKVRSRILDDKSKLEYVIIGNELCHYVGIGWISVRVVTMDDLKKYPRAVD